MKEQANTKLIKRLHLKRETVRVLTPSELDAVQGGGPVSEFAKEVSKAVIVDISKDAVVAISKAINDGEGYKYYKEKVSKVCCFPGGEVVATAAGERPIDSIRAGDRVLAPCFDTGAVVEQRVRNVCVHPGEFDLLAVRAGAHTLDVTDRHLFGTSAGWIPSDDLEAGALLAGVTDVVAVDNASRPSRWKGTVYNLEVDGGAYFVGRTSVLVRDH